MYGSNSADALFGGPGHDLLYGGYGNDEYYTEDAKQLHGEDGDDEIWASLHGNNDITGGAGDDLILAGIHADAGLKKANFPRLPRES